MRTATQTPEQRADVIAAQEFHQLQKFAAACRRQWPGAKIVLRPDGPPERPEPCQSGCAHADNASDDPVQSEKQKPTRRSKPNKQTMNDVIDETEKTSEQEKLP
jgi:hypothetical protein